jgi:hypothetical protein
MKLLTFFTQEQINKCKRYHKIIYQKINKHYWIFNQKQYWYSDYNIHKLSYYDAMNYLIHHLININHKPINDELILDQYYCGDYNLYDEDEEYTQEHFENLKQFEIEQTENKLKKLNYLLDVLNDYKEYIIKLGYSMNESNSLLYEFINNGNIINE